MLVKIIHGREKIIVHNECEETSAMTYHGIDAKQLKLLKSLELSHDQLRRANERELNRLDGELAKMTIHQQEPDTYWRGETLNLLLLGKTGSGKSSTGNLLLGRTEFSEDQQSESLTQDIQHEQCYIDGISVNVIDTPGLIDTSRGSESVLREITKVFDMFHNGIHGFLFVYNGAVRFTAEEKLAFNQLQGHLGPTFLDYCFVIITHGKDILHTTGLWEYLVLEEESDFGHLLHRCANRRVILVENGESTEYGREEQRRQVMGLITSRSRPYNTYKYRPKKETINPPTINTACRVNQDSDSDSCTIL